MKKNALISLLLVGGLSVSFSSYSMDWVKKHLFFNSSDINEEETVETKKFSTQEFNQRKNLGELCENILISGDILNLGGEQLDKETYLEIEKKGRDSEGNYIHSWHDKDFKKIWSNDFDHYYFQFFPSYRFDADVFALVDPEKTFVFDYSHRKNGNVEKYKSSAVSLSTYLECWLDYESDKCKAANAITLPEIIFDDIPKEHLLLKDSIELKIYMNKKLYEIG